MNLRTEILTDLKRWEEIARPWERLSQESSFSSFFLNWPWLFYWWKHYGQKHSLRCLLLWNGEQLVAAAPLYVRQDEFGGLANVRQVRMVGDGGNVASDHLGFLALPGKEEVLIQRMVEYWLSHRDWEVWYLRALSEDCPALAQLIAAFQAKGKIFQREPMEESCPYIPLPADWEVYLKSLSDNMQRNVQRRRRKLYREHQVEHVSYQEPSRVSEGLTTLAHLHEQSKALQGIDSKFMDPAYTQFHQELASELARRGILHLSGLQIDGRLAAIQYGFEFRKRLLAYQTGFEPDFKSLGVFQLHFGYLAEEGIKQGLEEIDLLRGAESYKFDWTASQRLEYCLRLSNPGTWKGLLLRFRDWLRDKPKKLKQ